MTRTASNPTLYPFLVKFFFNLIKIYFPIKVFAFIYSYVSRWQTEQQWYLETDLSVCDVDMTEYSGASHDRSRAIYE